MNLVILRVYYTPVKGFCKIPKDEGDMALQLKLPLWPSMCSSRVLHAEFDGDGGKIWSYVKLEKCLFMF